MTEVDRRLSKIVDFTSWMGYSPEALDQLLDVWGNQ